MKRFLILAAVVALTSFGTINAQWVDPPPTGTGPIYYTGGNVGIGTSNPQSLLHLAGPSGVSSLLFDTPGVQNFRFGSLPAVPNWGGLTLNASFNGSGWVLEETASNGWFLKLDGRETGATVSSGLWLWRIPPGGGTHFDETPQFGVTNGRAYFATKLTIGTTPDSVQPEMLYVQGNGRFTGSLIADGNIAAKYQDIAEWVSTSDTLAPGTVVVVDPLVRDGVAASNRAYQTSVAGVVSAQPGLVLGEAGDSKAQIATMGRVKVRVDATHGPIVPGDLLVTSNESGTAMRSEQIDIGGVKIHRPGTIVGKALEPLASGKGEILVLLSLQ